MAAVIAIATPAAAAITFNLPVEASSGFAGTDIFHVFCFVFKGKTEIGNAAASETYANVYPRKTMILVVDNPYPGHTLAEATDWQCGLRVSDKSNFTLVVLDRNLSQDHYVGTFPKQP